jgi:hypothetical protein
MNKKYMQDIVKKRYPAEYDEEISESVLNGFGRIQEQKRRSQCKQNEIKRGWIFGYVDKREDRKEYIFLCAPGIQIAIDIDGS